MNHNLNFHVDLQLHFELLATMPKMLQRLQFISPPPDVGKCAPSSSTRPFGALRTLVIPCSKLHSGDLLE